jgi:asparagine synthase (glutamine-hydrolysing)
MRDTMIHRGPDDSGIWWSKDRRLGLGHRRLSILDLTPTGHQPMEDSAGQYVITFNGEIYNYIDLRTYLIKKGHSFRSTSDTEVLLESYKEWGVKCLDHLNGTFAFAIFDLERHKIFLARDRAGEKPLYFKPSPDRFIFASELKALMADPSFSRTLDLDSLNCYLTYGYVLGERTILKDTFRLLPGHAMTYDVETQRLNNWCYWNLPDFQGSQKHSEEEEINELEELLSDSVKRQLIADVPVGILLSGGLDSSLITAIAVRKYTNKISTFTVSFPGHDSFDESPHAEQISKYFGTDHHNLVAEPSSVLLLEKIAKQFDEPLADHSIVPMTLLTDLVGKSISVALGGDGGDELFGGYPHYNYLQKIEQIRKVVPLCIRNGASKFGSKLLPTGMRGANHLIGLAGERSNSHAAVNIYFHKSVREELIRPLYSSGYTPLMSPEEIKFLLYDHSLTNFQNAARMDFHSTLADDYLVKSDRTSMLNSLELRAPFLDYKLIEFAYGRLNDTYRATKYERKILLKKLAKRLLPPTFDFNRKQGFTLPLNSWIKGDWGSYVREVLFGADKNIFNLHMIHKLMKYQLMGLPNANRLFAITMFELWRREYSISLP